MSGLRGIVCTRTELANEGPREVLDTIARTGANAVAVGRQLRLPSPNGTGDREPPLDVEGHRRVLDRPLWGEVVQTLAPAEDDRVSVPQVATWAVERGLQVFLPLSPTMSPRPDEDTTIRRVGGSSPGRFVVGQGCPSHPSVRDGAAERLRQILREVPDLAGVMIDWAEYACYDPEDIFTCFCEACQREAIGRGTDWSQLTAMASDLRARLAGVSTDRLLQVAEGGTEGDVVDRICQVAGATDDHRAALRLVLGQKASAVESLYRRLSQTLAAEGRSDVVLGANTFAPPWSALAGSALGLDTAADRIHCKLFSFHWPMMTRWLAELLLGGHDSGEFRVRAALTAARTIYDLPGGGVWENHTILGPDERQPLTAQDLLAHYDRAASDRNDVQPYLHSYRTLQEWSELLDAFRARRPVGAWVQRFGYLSAAKLDLLRRFWSAEID